MVKEEKIEVPVIRLGQKGLVLYQGKLKARDLLDLWDVKKFKDEHLQHPSISPGYQRETENRANKIATYVVECEIPLIPSILVSLRKGEFEELERDYGFLRIPREKGAIYVIDGQHRCMGFDLLKRSIEGERKPLLQAGGESLLDYEVPVTFIDARKAADLATEKIDKSILERELGRDKLREEDVERVFFFITNKTQKSLQATLKDVNMYFIASAGIKGIPIIEEQRWRADTVPIVRDLRYDPDSPLYGLIRIVGPTGAQRTIRFSSFISSLEDLMRKNERFASLDRQQQVQYLKRYWGVLRGMFPLAFREDRTKDFLILRTISVYALNRLANDIFNWCQENGPKVPTEAEIQKHLKPLAGFDWSRENSPIAAFGGQKGAEQTYILLLKKLAEGGNEKAKKRLESLEAKQRRKTT